MFQIFIHLKRYMLSAAGLVTNAHSTEATLDRFQPIEAKHDKSPKMFRLHVHYLLNSAYTHCLAVLDPAHINSPLSECLSLHVNSVFADKSISTLASSDNALTGSLSVVLGVSAVKLVGYACLSHDRN